MHVVPNCIHTSSPDPSCVPAKGVTGLVSFCLLLCHFTYSTNQACMATYLYQEKTSKVSRISFQRERARNKLYEEKPLRLVFKQYLPVQILSLHAIIQVIGKAHPNVFEIVETFTANSLITLDKYLSGVSAHTKYTLLRVGEMTHVDL